LDHIWLRCASCSPHGGEVWRAAPTTASYIGLFENFPILEKESSNSPADPKLQGHVRLIANIDAIEIVARSDVLALEEMVVEDVAAG
jgi:hypothetical protein